ncbi:hypothetical protein Pcar_3007 [Syntrophotalea carbinolica DSM 2380]|uniref:SHOCT domain-containing protein n=1 Tax=Syntrophotalea carbinolica (strain DSM 2380 / NBRC 103641 / GraBd1) TaxID=338963 RepID=Q3A065_SYNC1|nr:OmpH family outer membrane protein [Syntrophotalea carbinolica]ABA90242.1 hypothetical protein Pcar_3007 [Syntrophotalea carbinolica DSM 2380]
MRRKAVLGKTAMLYGRIIVTAVLALSFAGCGANLMNGKDAEVQSVIWKNKDQFVRIENQDHDSIMVASNDHPAKLSPNLIRKTLGSLEVQFEGEENPVPVFSPEELDILGDTLSRGLAQAGPREDVTFAIAGVHQGHVGPEISTYRLFVAKDRLNLIIGTLHQEYTPNSDQSTYPLMLAGRKYTLPSNRNAQTGWTIVPRVGMKYKTNGALTSDVVTRRDWLILNPTPESFREAAQMWEDSAQFESEQQKMQRKIDKMEQSIEQMKQNSMSGAPAAAPAAAEPMGLNKIEQRLQMLQQLKNKGLINEEDFLAKKQEILDSI